MNTHLPVLLDAGVEGHYWGPDTLFHFTFCVGFISQNAILKCKDGHSPLKSSAELMFAARSKTVI